MVIIMENRTIPTSGIHRILIRATNWIGDMVMSLPAIEAVRDIFPSGTISVLAKPWVIPLINHNPVVDRVIPFQKGRGPIHGVIEIVRVSRLIRRMRFDLAILFQNAFEAALITYLGGIKYRLGYDTDGRRFLLTHAVTKDKQTRERHHVEHYISLLRAVGWDAKTKDPVLSINERDGDSIQSLLLSEGIEEDDLLIGLSPGAVFGPAKRWPPERFAAIGDWAVERWGAKIVLLGGPGEQGICALLAEHMKRAPFNVCGRTTLRQAMALIKRCRFFVTNDSGLMHVAAALDVPTIAIFGSTNHVATGPRNPKARIVRRNLHCAPCLKRECPINYDCMTGIEPEDVWKEMEILKEMTS